MIECCSTCNKYMKLEKSDYSGNGCKHSDYDGFACLAFADEGIVVHMVGVNPDKGMCELHSDREPSAYPKTGKWILIRPDEDKAGNGLYECSECGKGDIHAPEVEVPYCWHCGAHMTGSGSVKERG